MEVRIGGREVGDGHPVFIIAEAGVNHNGSVAMACDLVDAAATAGADAVKFQTFRAERLNTRKAPKSSYHVETTGGDSEQTWFELLKTQELDREAHESVLERCRLRGIEFLSTPYDEESADLLGYLGVSAFKLASTDTTNLRLIRHIATMGRPLILSTAMCDMEEVREAVTAARGVDLHELVVMQCTGNYPSRSEDSHLRVLQTFRRELECLTGYSDHTLEMINPVAATALGACVYEKHFTLDRALPGPDHRMSLSPEELGEMVTAIRATEMALGSSVKQVLESEEENRVKLRKSLVAARDLPSGLELSDTDLVAKRPGTGISPACLRVVLGRRLARDVAADTILTEDDLE